MKLNLPVLGSREVGFPKYRRSNPPQTGAEYRYRQPVHDFYGVTVATALTRQVLFSLGLGSQYTPSGGAALAKTAWHTNVPNPGGSLPNPNSLMVRGMSLSIDPRTLLADANRFLFQSYLTFIIIDRPYLETHAWRVPSAGGVYAGGSAGAVMNGEPSRFNMWTFEGSQGEYIRPQQNFSVTIDPTISVLADATAILTTAAAAAGGVGLNAFVHLDGLFNRMVT